MNAEYRHTQFGLLMFVVFFASGILIAVIVFETIADGRLGHAIFDTSIYLLGLALFYTSTIEIADGKLKFWFGIGLIRKTVHLSDIQSVRAVTNPWYYFWGIKSIPGGWLYAIAPGPAVEIILKNGKLFHFGTDQPELLKEAIDAAK